MYVDIGHSKHLTQQVFKSTQILLVYWIFSCHLKQFFNIAFLIQGVCGEENMK